MESGAAKALIPRKRASNMEPRNQSSKLRESLAVDADSAREEARAKAAAPVLRLLKLAGSGLWKGDLAEIRDDAPPANS